MTLLLRSLHMSPIISWCLGQVSHELLHQDMPLLHHCLSPHLIITIPSKGTVHTSVRSSAVLGLPTSWHKASTITPSPQEGGNCLPVHLLSMVHLLIEKIRLQCCMNKTHTEKQIFLKNQKHMHQNVNVVECWLIFIFSTFFFFFYIFQMYQE